MIIILFLASGNFTRLVYVWGDWWSVFEGKTHVRTSGAPTGICNRETLIKKGAVALADTWRRSPEFRVIKQKQITTLSDERTKRAIISYLEITRKLSESVCVSVTVTATERFDHFNDFSHARSWTQNLAPILFHRYKLKPANQITVIQIEP